MHVPGDGFLRIYEQDELWQAMKLERYPFTTENW